MPDIYILVKLKKRGGGDIILLWKFTLYRFFPLFNFLKPSHMKKIYLHASKAYSTNSLKNQARKLIFFVLKLITSQIWWNYMQPSNMHASAACGLAYFFLACSSYGEKSLKLTKLFFYSRYLDFVKSFDFFREFSSWMYHIVHIS